MSTKTQMQYGTVPKGTNELYLVNIKEKIKKASPKFLDSKDRPGIQLTFRSVNDPSCFVNWHVGYSFDPDKSNLVKGLRKMSGRLLNKQSTQDEYEAFLASCLWKPFILDIEHSESKDPKRPYCNVVDNDIKPSAANKIVDAQKLFSEWDSTHEFPMPTRTSGMGSTLKSLINKLNPEPKETAGSRPQQQQLIDSIQPASFDDDDIPF